MDILTIILAVLTVLTCFLSYYLHVKAKVYAETENAVNTAEQDDKTAAEKMALAVDQIYGIIPVALKPFFTRKIIEKIVQKAFDKIEEYATKQVNKKRKGEDVENVEKGA